MKPRLNYANTQMSGHRGNWRNTPGRSGPNKTGNIFISNPIISHRNCNQMIAFSNRKRSHIHINTDGCGHVCVLVDKRCCENGRQNESQLVFLVFPSAVFIFLYSCPFVAFFFLTVQMSLASWEKRAGKKRKNCRHIGKLSAHVKKLLCALGHSFVWAAGN